MIVGEPIEISSSDSDFEIEDVRDNIESANGRSLPSWAFTHDASPESRGNPVQSRKVPSPRRAYASNGSSLLIDSHAQAKNPIHPHSSGAMGASNRHVARADDSKCLPDNVNHQAQSVNSQIGNTSSIEYEKISPQLALKRTIPPSLPTSVTDIKSKSSVDYNSRSQIHNSYGGSYHSVGPKSVSSRSYMRDHSGWAIDNHENGGSSRILSPSLAQIGFSRDPAHRSGMGEERVAESDESLIYQAALKDLNQPKVEANLPDGLLSVPLLRHQKIALAWMLQKESRSFHCSGGILADDQGLGKTVSMIALIQMQKSLDSKAKPEEVSNHIPEALNLDDDDDNDGNFGLEKGKKTEEFDDIKLVPAVSISVQSLSNRRPAAGTLVVCPASILRQWDRELDEKVAKEAKLSVLIYHGGSRTKDPVALAKYDVVLTTYSIVTNEAPKQPLVDEDDPDEKVGEKYGSSSEFSTSKKRKMTSVSTKKGKKGRKDIDSNRDCGPIGRVGWLRVILDEAQTIKNHRTQVARACCGLKAKRRWCLSGTPIQNAIDDLYSYFRFLRYDPYAVYKSFYNTIKVPISKNSIQGYKKLQVVLRAIMLRRAKGTLIDGEPIIKLPPKTIELTRVDFASEERAFYTQLEADSRSQFKAYAAAGTVNQNYANILLMLLRLRQACDHPSLVQGYNSDFVAKDSVEMARTLPKEMLLRLLSLLEDSKAICCICASEVKKERKKKLQLQRRFRCRMDPPENPVITMCDHIFCYQCVSDNLTVDDSICPATGCKEQIGSDIVFSKATLRRCISSDFDGGPSYSEFTEKVIVMQNEYSSSKIRAILEILQSNCNSSISNSDSQGYERNDENLCSGKEKTDSGSSGLSVVKRTTFSNSSAEGTIKYIIFSQWTGMLDLVEQSLNQFRIRYRRLDGTMTLTARDSGVREFNTNPKDLLLGKTIDSVEKCEGFYYFNKTNVTVMLMSLKAGNLGLNMVAACHVILLDLWWNPSTEDQAVDRAHRIGQTRPVTVTRLTIKDTVEDRILALQEDKRKMVASAFGEDHGGGAATRLTVEDLRYLFMV